MTYDEIINQSQNITEAYKVIDTFKVYIGTQSIGIKISEGFRNLKGKYYYSNSHWYHGSQQAGPYISSRNRFDTKEQALMGALKELTSFYREDDSKAKWVRNENF